MNMVSSHPGKSAQEEEQEPHELHVGAIGPVRR